MNTIKMEQVENYTAKTNRYPVYNGEVAELRECPFCGGDVNIVFTLSGDTAHVVCKNCGVTSPRIWLGRNGQRGMVRTLEDTWNRNVYDVYKDMTRTLKDKVSCLRASESDLLCECYAKAGTLRRYKKNADIESDFVQ